MAHDIPYESGALYIRREDIHGRYGGQERGGISTPSNCPFVFLFTGEAGIRHGYTDRWDDDNIFHYFGEGQAGDMRYVRGNRAIRDHTNNNKRLLVFQSMGRGQSYRFWGEFRYVYAYEQSGVQDTEGNLREAIVFKLEPIQQDFNPFLNTVTDKAQLEIDLSETVSRQFGEVRSKQALFKRRLLTVEKQCRVTGIADLRFLRASHIKPWAKCISGNERTDGNNGLLLSPHADFLFDRGWITFEDSGALVRSNQLPKDVIDRIGLNLKQGRNCGNFFEEQKKYFEYHRNAVFEKSFKKVEDPLLELFTTTAP